MTDRRLAVILEGDATQLSGVLRAAADQIEGVGNATEKAGDQAEQAGKQADEGAKRWAKAGQVLGAAAAAAVAGLTALVTMQINAADSAGEMAERLSVSSEWISGMGLAAKLSGTDIDTLERGLGMLSTVMAKAAGGGREQQQVFQALGVSATDVHGQLVPLEQILPQIADRFAAYRDGPEKAALATRLFGDAGRDLVPLLNQGSAGIDALRERAQALGLVIGSETAAKAGELNDRLDDLIGTARGLGTELASQVLPYLVDGATALTNWIIQAREDGTLRNWGNAALEVGQAVLTLAGYVDDLALFIGTALAVQAVPAAIATLGGLTTGLSGVAAGIKAITLAMASNPLLLISIAAGAAAVAIYNYATSEDDATRATNQLEDATRALAGAQGNSIEVTLQNTISRRNETAATIEQTKAEIDLLRAKNESLRAAMEQQGRGPNGLLVQAQGGSLANMTSAANQGQIDRLTASIEEMNAAVQKSDVEIAKAEERLAAWKSGAQQAGTAATGLTPPIVRSTEAMNRQAREARESERRQRELARAQEEHADALRGLNGIIEQTSGTMSGPMRQALEQNRRDMDALDQITQQLMQSGVANADVLQLLQAAYAGVTAAAQARIQAARDEENISGQLLADLDAEIALLQMSAEARRTELLVRQAVMEAQRIGHPLSEQEIADLRNDVAARLAKIDALEEQARSAEQLSADMTNAVGNFVDNALDGVGSVGDAFKDLGKDILDSIKASVSASIAEFAKLNVINPILNKVLGGNLPTGNGQLGGLLGNGGVGGLIGSAVIGYGLGGTRGAVGGAIGGQIGSAFGPIGQAVGSFIGGLLGGLGKKPDDIRLGGTSASVRSVEGNFSTVFGTVRAGSRGISYQDFIKPVQDFDRAMQELVTAAGGGTDQLEEIRARLATWSVDIKGDAATVEAVLNSRFSAILTTFEADVQAFVGSAGTVEERVKRLGDALAIAQAVDAGDLGDSFQAVSDLLLDYRQGTESLEATYARLQGSVALLDEALELSGVTLTGTREEVIRFAADITEAAGSLQRAQALWSGYFQNFYSEEERRALAIAQATRNSGEQFGEIGLNAADFQSAGGMQRFREIFEQVLPTLSADAVVEWLEAGESLANLIQLQGTYNEVLGQQISEMTSLQELMQGVDDALAEFVGPATFAERIAAVASATEDLVKQALRMGASEADIARIRQLGQLRLNDILQEQTQALAEYSQFVGQFRPDGSAGLSDFQLALRQITEEARDAAAQANELARAAGLSGAAEEDLANIQMRAAERMAEAAAQLEASILSLAEQLGYFEQVNQAAADFNSDLGFAHWLAEQQRAIAEAPTLDPSRFNLAVTLGGQMRELAEFVGESTLDTMARLRIPLDRLVADFGVAVDQLDNPEVFDRFLQAARVLGVEAVEAAQAIGTNIGELGDATSLLNDAFERALARLPDSVRGQLDPLLRDYESASTPEAQAAARQALVSAIDQLPPNLRAILAPFLDEIDTTAIAEQQLSAAEQSNRYLSASVDHLAAIRAALSTPIPVTGGRAGEKSGDVDEAILRELRAIGGRIDALERTIAQIGARMVVGINGA